MNPLLLGGIFEIGKTLIERFVPDPEKKAQAELEMLRMAADGELKTVLAQLEINAREAQHPSFFVAGWRPAFGWIGAAGIFYAVIVHPFVNIFVPTLPAVNVDLLWAVVSGMLGIGGLRSFEKTRGVEAK